MSEKMYYILSLKWTQKHLPAFNFWQAKDSGYALILKTDKPDLLFHAGLYTEAEVMENRPYYDNRDTSVAIPQAVVESHAVTADGIPMWRVLDGQTIVPLESRGFRKVIRELAPDWKGPRK